MQSSLVVAVGNAKINEEDAFEFAEAAGVKFIKLRHEKGAGGSKQTIRGFQGVNVKVSESREGGRKFNAEPTKNSQGEDGRAFRPLQFIPEGRTKMLTAYLPDTPYNREKLARNFFGRSMCTVVDPETHSEIKKRAEEIAANLPKGPTKEEVISAQANENAMLRKALEENEAKVKELQQQNEVIKEARATIKELEPEVKDSIREIVHEENKTFIENLKKQAPQKWETTKKYKDMILPIIAEREKQELERLNANNSGVGK